MLTAGSFYGFGRGMTDFLSLKGEVDDIEAIRKAMSYSAIGQTILFVGIGLFPLRISSICRNKITIWVPSFFSLQRHRFISFSSFGSLASQSPVSETAAWTASATLTGDLSRHARLLVRHLDFWYAAFPR
jgi:hypothetical protein